MRTHRRASIASLIALRFCIGLAACVFTLPSRAEPAREFEVRLPSGAVSIVLAVSEQGRPTYRVTYGGKPVVMESSLGMTFDQSGPLANLRVIAEESSKADKTYALVAGKTSTARDHYAEKAVTFVEVGDPHRKVRLTVRAYDDAAAFRYDLPEQPALTEFALTSEDSTFALPPDATSWWLPLKDFTTPHEALYKTGKLADVPAGQVVGLPILYHVPDGPWAAITEANLTDYAGLYLTPAADKPGTFTAALSPLPGPSRVKVRGRAPHASPWRVVIVGDSPGKLIESNAVLNLNEPCALADTSWIKPGKVSFLWWNGYVVAPPAVVGPLNTATLIQYVDFAADHDIPFASIDGSDHAWYGGPCAPYQGADVTVPIPELDLPAVFAHAKERGVRMRIWVNYHGLKRQVDKALELYAKWGAEGVMVDMIERDDQEAVNLMRHMIAKCAELHMTVTLHNVTKPTGLERTYPNLRTSEAVLNDEYNKWDPIGSPPAHELTVPFVRMLAGPLDFHQGGFRSVRPEEFKPHNVAPVVMGTRCHQLAMYVVYEDALPMVVDFPAAYEGQDGFEFVRDVPTTWDETHVIDGDVGKRLTIARRKGQEWYVGSMAGGDAAAVAVPLTFLPGGASYFAETWADDPARGPNATAHEKKRVTSADTVGVRMSAAGGHVMHLTPAEPKGEGTR